ncbi:MAG TPA: hypothetical protein VNL16_12570 [Chloroflexota bacterium]|nr:hypothetical protein [Chloroflexota bacterium]
MTRRQDHADDEDRVRAGSEEAAGEKKTRRTVVKAGAAVAGGLALSTVYVKPSILSVDFAETAHASGDPGHKSHNKKGHGGHKPGG